MILYVCNNTDQVVPSPSKKRKTEEEEGGETDEGAEKERSTQSPQRTLPEVSDNTKLLDLFGGSTEIFASSREE